MGEGNGNIRGGPDGNWEGAFTTGDGFGIRVAGTFSPPIPFFVELAILQYTELADLVGTFNMTQGATMGPATITLPFISNKGHPVTILGPLVPPFPDPEPIPIKGKGTWAIL
ncbi:hypothetical protein BDV26DRAFT_270511 [Aspergillus bertholletiae]|uniref:Uncharacterized protein n=1 Tax=Aspergillus bertholletiae TaxID=1226010 RepID=A0A5N7AWS0_9EURO|nr:hypothetical protein BDV26DRAFT_270511 [Aspergillus bertholletiae]